MQDLVAPRVRVDRQSFRRPDTNVEDHSSRLRSVAWWQACQLVGATAQARALKARHLSVRTAFHLRPLQLRHVGSDKGAEVLRRLLHSSKETESQQQDGRQIQSDLTKLVRGAQTVAGYALQPNVEI